MSCFRVFNIGDTIFGIFDDKVGRVVEDWVRACVLRGAVGLPCLTLCFLGNFSATSWEKVSVPLKCSALVSDPADPWIGK